MPKLPDFLFSVNESALPGVRLIFSTSFPFYIGKIIEFKTFEEYNGFINRFANNVNFEIFTKINGYRIIILYYGSLSYIDPSKNQKSVKMGLGKMANFYFKEKIIKNPTAYKRFKEN